ncbi:hypothetical protein F4604DRAFT_1955589 [Suillus subluteus]|nr:hypothetical protein F4604DRAFT_1955589 [Suillus subluteus]
MTCQLPRVLDILPSVGQTPPPATTWMYKSPTLSPYPYTFPQPLLRLVTKSITSAMKSVLHILFLPTPFESNAYQGTDTPEEVLKAGALYRKCDTVNLRIPSPTMTDAVDVQVGHGLGVYNESATYETNVNLSNYGGQTALNLQGKHRTQMRESVLPEGKKLPPMGNTLSLIRLELTEFLDNLHTFQTFQARIQRFLELSLPNPSRSFWSYLPSPIAAHGSQPPMRADFVVVDSGTGTSVVRRLLDSASAEGNDVRVLCWKREMRVLG